MNIQSYIQTIQVHLIRIHSNVLDWFREAEDLKNFRPEDGGWTVSEILEHIALTSHYLLILIDKASGKALRNVKELSLEELLNDFDFDLSKMDEIGIHKSFAWVRPEHMEPTGEKSEWEIKNQMISHVTRCLNQLDKLKKGKGLLQKTTMSVNDLGKINVYEYIYFLSKHAERHIQQMEANKLEFIKNKFSS